MVWRSLDFAAWVHTTEVHHSMPNGWNEEQVDAGSSQSRSTIAEDRKRMFKASLVSFSKLYFRWIQIGTASCSNMAEAA